MNNRLSFLILAAISLALTACGGGGEANTLIPPEPSTARLTVNKLGSGGVTSTSPSGIDCGNACDLSVTAGTSVSLSATPSAGYTFVGWNGSGVDCSSSATCTVLMDAAKVVTATFNDTAAPQAAWTVNVAGSGAVSTGLGTDCTADCSGQVPKGTALTFTATPATGYKFSGWSVSGLTCANTGPCQVVMSVARSLTATFTLEPQPTLRLSVSTSGSGAVGSLPAGIACGIDCSEDFAKGTVVSLAATPAAGFSFSGWSGGECVGTGTCVVEMSAARTVGAAFSAVPANSVALNVVVSGAGVVTSSPSGINCPTDCVEIVALGTSVTLTAVPTAGNRFSGWSGGACTGTTACVISLTKVTSVGAIFVPITYSVSVTKQGSGTVTSNPSGIACGSTCSANYAANASVTLTAVALSGYSFTGWSGACTGSAVICAITANADKAAAATFSAVGTGDTLAPTVVITSPSSSAIYTSASASVAFSGSASDNVGVTQVGWSNNRGGSGTATLSGANWSAGSVALQTGTNTLSVTARDAAGNTASSSVVVTYGSTAGATTYYLSPTGNNGADCKSVASACKSFAYVFSRMVAGDELILLDGTYSAAAGTGSMSWNDGANSAQIPSGSAARSTFVHALNPGKVTIQGGLFIGRSTRKDSYITVQGLSFEGGAVLYNTSFVTIKEVGVHGSLDLGTNDHEQGNTDNLIEDVWVWAAQQRIIAINYRAHRNVWRRVVVRGDGCNTTECLAGGSPNVGFTVYDSHDVSVQNVIVVDRVLTGVPTTNYYSDFAIASHTGGLWTFGRNEWLGTISLNAPDSGYYMEPDVGTTETPTIKVSNAVAWNSASGGYNVARSAQNITLENLTLNTRSDDAFRVAPELSNAGTVKNLLISGVGKYALNSAIPASNVNISGAWTAGVYNQTTPSNVLSAASAQKYIVRIESGSPLKGAGAGGADIGANVLFRYGADGTRHGAAGFNSLGTTSLWPWPNEDRIKREMCAATARGFCTTGKRLDGTSPVTLSSYVWEALGNAIPAGIYP